MLKKGTLSQAFSCKFCEFLHNDGFWDFIQQIFGWMLLNLLIIEPAFCERDKDHKFDNFETIPC